MDIKIPELPEASTSYDSDLLVVEQNTGTKKVTKENFFGDQIKFDELGLYEGATPINADQLEGHSASYFQRLLTAGEGINISNNVISNKYTNLSSVNLNDINYLYLGQAMGNCTNLPIANTGGQLISIPREDGAYRFQMFSRYNNDDIYTRTYNNGTWTAWRKLSDSYMPGDTLDMSQTNRMYCGATSNATNIYIMIPLAKPIAATSISISSLKLTARGINGIDVNNVDVVADSNYTVTPYINDTGLTIRVIGPANTFTANTPYVCVCVLSGTFS